MEDVEKDNGRVRQEDERDRQAEGGKKGWKRERKRKMRGNSKV